MFSKFRELGLSVFPLLEKSKRPVAEMTGWQRYCNELPTEEECAEWDFVYSGSNVGLACGAASKLIALDIDEPEFLEACPDSPLIRGGKLTRQTRFFKFNPEIRSMKIRKPGAISPAIEILSTGNYTVIPPSIHPDTLEPYFWISEDSLETFDIEKLPELTAEDVERLRMAVEGGLSSDFISRAESLGVENVFTNDDPSRKSPHGSQDRLKNRASHFIKECMPLDEGVMKLLEYDREHHKPCGYFYEGRTSDSLADPFTNASKFYMNILSFINRQQKQAGEAPYIPRSPSPLKEVAHFRPAISPSAPYTKPEGVMKTFIDYCEMCTTSSASSQLGLGSALCFLSVLAANRVWAKVDQFVITPNIFVLNLAASGTGKEVVQKLIIDLLSKTGQKLLGATMYRSGTSIIKSLPKQQNRLDIIDEASGLFKTLGEKSVFQSEMVEILCSLFSKASSEFSGAMTATSEVPIGACYQPHLTILASTTLAGFHTSVTKEVALKGLLPRFLTFYQRDRGAFNKSFDEQAEAHLKSKLENFVEQFLLTYPLQTLSSQKNFVASVKNADMENIAMGVRYSPRIFEFTPDAKQRWQQYREDIFNEVSRIEEGFDEAFKNRFGELAGKLALLHALSAQKTWVELADVLWGIEIVELQWANCKDVHELARAESFFHSATLKIKSAIRRAGGKITKQELCRKTQALGKSARDQAIAELLEAGELFQEVDLAATRPITSFYLPNYVNQENKAS